VIIRPPIVSDIPAIFDCHYAAVWSKAKVHYEEKILQAWSPGPSAERIIAAEAELTNSDVIFRVAEVASTIIGFGIVLPLQNEFRALYVKPTTELGVGKSICEVLLQEARKASCSHLDLQASLNAVNFYLRMGAVILTPVNHTFQGGVVMPAMKMRFDLNKVT
jgi:Acetyltransferase (GNAT) domain